MIPNSHFLSTIKYFFSLCFVVFVITNSWSQTHKGEIKNISEDGLHKILLSPEIRSASSSNTGYIRILDSDKNEVSYFVIDETNELRSSFISFLFNSENSIKDSITSIVIENLEQLRIDQLTFKIANTEVNKSYNISGSNDNTEWYALINEQVLFGKNDNKNTTIERTFAFPINNYKYLKFVFNDKNSLPLNILDIGRYKNTFTAGSKIAITDFKTKITAIKENKSTQIAVSFQTPQIIDEISFAIATSMYLRAAKILINKTYQIKKRTKNYQETIYNFELNSQTNNTFQFFDLFEKDFIIEIQNEDNQPLDITSLKFYQKPLYIVANLKSHENYEIVVDTTLAYPSYDLANFKANIKSDLPQTTVENLTKINGQAKKELENKSFWQTDLFMWVCILLAIVVIGYFALGLLKDMKG